jgi:hypothetical protein
MMATLVEINERLSTDDAPLWAEVLGVVFALGLAVRAQAHVTVALLHGLDPCFRGHDVSVKSPVARLRPGTTPDALGRLLSFGVALVLLELALTSTAPAWATTFVIAQASIPFADAFWITSAMTHNHER